MSRKTRSDKKVKVLCGVSQSNQSQSDHEKLEMLATALGMTKTKLCEHFITTCLNTENIVEWYQNKYGKFINDKYRITIVKTKDGIDYI